MLDGSRVVDEAWPCMRLGFTLAIAQAQLAVSYHVQVPDAVVVVKQRCAAQRAALEHACLQRVAAKEGRELVLHIRTICIELDTN